MDPQASVLAEARQVIEAEGRAVLGLARQLDSGFVTAVDRILNCQGRVVVTGMGKSGLVAQKVSATLASTGTTSLFLHAADAAHGDLGRIRPQDVVIVMSNSGESEEIIRLIRPIKSLGAVLIAMTGDPRSNLAKHADVVLSIGHIREACSMGLVPTASTTAMMVMGDALAVCLFHRRGFGREDYARFHPGGQLGRNLLRVQEVMRTGEENPVVQPEAPIREVIVTMTKTAGRPGAATIVDERGCMVGFFTDGDLRRLLERRDFALDLPIHAAMNRDPKYVRPEQLVAEAAHVLRSNQIDQVPVVEQDGRAVGLLDVQDLLVTRVV